MTALPITEPLTLAPVRAPRWRGLGEFLVVGGATPVLLALSWLVRRKVPLDDAELAVGFTMFHAAHLINDPHFAVTYLLFYRDARARAFGGGTPPADRLRYLVAGAAVPLVLAVWAIAGLALQSPRALGWMMEAMFALVGWHYVKQGFGVAVALAARRGVTFLPRERRALLAHGLAGWAFAWANPASPAREVEEKGVVYVALAHPRWFELATGTLLALTLVAVVVLLALKWRREHRLPLVTPLTAMLASIWAWSIFSSADPLVRYAVPALHSVQYLYFVGVAKGNEAREREAPPWFDTAAKARLGLLACGALGLGWILFHGAPTLLDEALVPKKARFTDLGPTPYFAALYAFVNIHHYFMDSAIWRRGGPLARYLRAPVAVSVHGERRGTLA